MPTVILRTLDTVLGTPREQFTNIRYSSAPGGWLSRMLILLEQRTDAGRRSSVYALRRVVELIHATKRLRELSSVEPPALHPALVREILETIELAIDSLDLRVGTKSALSMTFRRTFFRALPTIGSSPGLSARTVGFTTKLKGMHSPRGLISDFSKGDIPPIGATEYEDVRSLKQTIHRRLQDDLATVRSAAVADLEAGVRARQFLQHCAELPIDINFIAKVHQVCVNPNLSKHAVQYQFRRKMDEYVGALVLIHLAAGWAGENIASESPQKRVVRFGPEVDKHISEAARCQYEQKQMVQMLEVACAQEIYAAAVVLQTATGWNVQSVLSLSQEGVRRKDSIIELQSFKGKTDDDTPPAYFNQSEAQSARAVIDSDYEVDRAVQLLEWNHQQMVLLGLKSEKDSGLFRCAFARRHDKRITFRHLHCSFLKRHGLPKFTPEQIRVQFTYANSVESLEMARRKAGHKQIATTGRYVVQHEIAKRLHSSLNLEMQRRLESELRYDVGGGALRGPRLLRSIGDGASCADVSNPPLGFRVFDGSCEGVRCHSAGGCPNRRIIINEERVKEVLLTERIYRENWSSLVGSNPHEFLERHVDAILFNRALLRVLTNGRFAHVVARFQKEGTK